jgi:hypothetical protein
MDPWAPANVTYEEYVAMCGCPPVMGIEGMLAHYSLSMAQWTQLAAHWNGIIATNPHYVQHRMRVEQEAARIRAGGAPRPIAASAPAVDPSMNAVSGAMPGAVPPPGYGPSPAASTAFVPSAAPGYAAQPPGYATQPPQPPGYAQQPPPGCPQAGAPPAYPQQPQQPGYPPQPPPGYGPPQQAGYPAPQQPGYPQQSAYPQPGYPPQPVYNQQAAAFGNSVGNAFSAFGDALGSVVNSVVGTLSPGQAVMVQWSDGNRYPASVIIAQSGQVEVAFPDGRRVWVPQAYVVPR